MLRPSLGGAVIFFSLQHFNAPALDYCPACKPKVWGIQFWGIFQVETLFKNVWPLLYKSANIDLRSTNNLIFIILRLWWMQPEISSSSILPNSLLGFSRPSLFSDHSEISLQNLWNRSGIATVLSYLFNLYANPGCRWYLVSR